MLLYGMNEYWLETASGLSYWILYFIIFLGIAVGAFQCYWTYTHVPLDKQPLCIVLGFG
jgi:hypothetical protein